MNKLAPCWQWPSSDPVPYESGIAFHPAAVLSEQAAEAIHVYVGAVSYALCRHLRGGAYVPDGIFDYADLQDEICDYSCLGIEGMIAGLDEFAASTVVAATGVVYRSVEGRLAHKLRAMVPGDILVDAAYMSTTLDRKTAVGYPLGVGSGDLMLITVPKGARVGVVGSYGSDTLVEHEILLPRNSRLKHAGAAPLGNGVYSSRFELQPTSARY